MRELRTTLALVLLALSPTVVAAATFNVNSVADTDDGTCAVTAGGCTLREAINAANATAAADTISFAGLGSGAKTIATTSHFTLSQPTTFSRGSLGTVTISQTTDTTALFSIQATTTFGSSFLLDANATALSVAASQSLTMTGVVLSGNSAHAAYLAEGSSFTCTSCNFSSNGSSASEFGGAISAHGTGASVVSLNLANCTFTGNASGRSGGAIYASNTALQLTNTSFTNNQTAGVGPGDNGGGAIYISAVEAATIGGCTFTSNGSSAHGGALFAYAPLSIDRSVFDSNAATVDGGAIYVQWFTTSVQDSRFLSNRAERGGAARGGTFLRCEFTENDTQAAAGAGGALYLPKAARYCTFTGNTADTASAIDVGSAPLIEHSTFVGNFAAWHKSGAIDSNAPGTQLRANIFVDNLAASASRACGTTVSVASTEHNVADDSSCGFSANDLTNQDASLLDFGFHGSAYTRTHKLAANSVAIDLDTVGPSGITGDQRGYGFVDGGSGSSSADAGAYEFGGYGIIELATDHQALVEPSTFAMALLNGGGLGASVVNYAYTAQSATAGTDFNATSGTVAIVTGAAQPNKISVSVLDDLMTEPDESFLLSLSLVGDVASDLGSRSEASLVVTRNDGLYADLTASVDTTTEGDGYTVTITLSGPRTGSVSVPFEITGSDFVASETSPLTFAPAVMSRTFTMTPSENSVDQPARTITVALGTPTGAELGSTTALALTVLDDDAEPSIGIATTSSTRSEGAGSVEFTLQLSAVSAYDVSVTLARSGTATAGTDYEDALGTTLTIAAGSSGRTVSLPIVGDTTDEPDEIIELTISAPSHATLGTDSVNITIEDDDAPPSVSFAATAATISESSATPHSATVSLSAASSFAVCVQVSCSGTAGLFDASTPTGAVTFAPGETTKVLHIAPTSDGVHETDEQVVLTLSSPSNASLGANTVFSLSLIDDDAAPTVSLSKSAATMPETAGRVTLTLTLTGATEADASIVLASSGSAVLLSDYSLSATTVVIPAGSSSTTVTLSALSDPLFELTESAVVTLGALSQATAGVTSSVTVDILDDDVKPSVSISSADRVIAEGASASVVVSLSEPSGVDTKVSLTTSGASASDCALRDNTVLILAGTTTASTTLDATDDGIAETDEAVEVSVVEASNATLGGDTVMNVTIDDVFIAELRASASATSVREGENVSIVLTLGAQPSLPVTVFASVLGPGSIVGPNTFTFDGSNFRTEQTLVVAGTQDTDVNGTRVLAVSFTVQSSDPFYAGLIVASLEIACTDDDAIAVPSAVAVAMDGAVSQDGTTPNEDAVSSGNPRRAGVGCSASGSAGLDASLVVVAAFIRRTTRKRRA